MFLRADAIGAFFIRMPVEKKSASQKNIGKQKNQSKENLSLVHKKII
jgi:hypothetical protein